MNQNIVKKIVLDIDSKKISLTPEQAQKLCTALMDLLKVEQSSVTLDEIKRMIGDKSKEYIPLPYPVYPHKTPYWEYEPYRVTWGYSSNDKCLCSATYSASNGTVSILL
jgi:hypothetical protein